MTSIDCHAENRSGSGRVREPAVDGRFYPGGTDSLRGEVGKYIAAGKKLESPAAMIISPHAGYVFSGPLAGEAFATLDPAARTVIILGPSHRAYFEGLSIADVEGYRTPLGVVRLDAKKVAALRTHAEVGSVRAAHEDEHCLEVQIPFVQTVLPEATIVPIVVGRIAPARAAAILAPLLDARTVVVASSDFSHYHAHETAVALDRRSIQTILDGDADGPLDACGEIPIRVVMRMARARHLRPVLLDARNSSEVAPQLGGRDQVVGYAAIAYVSRQGAVAEKTASDAGADTTEHVDELDEQARAYLLQVARSSLDAAVRRTKATIPADPPSCVLEHRGCFVTLTRRGVLRGCIGYIEPIKPLNQAVIENARNAALNDPRFPGVSGEELGDIRVEVSVLTPPRPLVYDDAQDLLSKLVPGRDGVILKNGFHQATFLPQVWEQLPKKEDFLSRLSLKAGMAADGWKRAEVRTYRANHFSEEQ